jgi:hypothetical protein
MHGDSDSVDCTYMYSMDDRPDDPTTGGRAPSTGVSPQRRWSDGVVAALLALADFTAFTVMLLHLISRYQHDHNDVGTNVNFMMGSDVATPLIGWVWFLILLNGIVLCTLRRARSAGVGLLVTAAAIATPVVVWLVWTLATFGSG